MNRFTKGAVSLAKKVPEEYYQYMSELQTVDFVLVELTLYLDTHPDDQQALLQFAQFQRRKAALTAQYSAAFGTLMEYGNGSSVQRWTWSEGPWPWQL